jgi:hypothetical protein
MYAILKDSNYPHKKDLPEVGSVPLKNIPMIIIINIPFYAK